MENKLFCMDLVCLETLFVLCCALGEISFKIADLQNERLSNFYKLLVQNQSKQEKKSHKL